MNLYQIIDCLYIRIAGRFQKTRSGNGTLIFCTIGMGEMVGMTELINRIPEAFLVIDRKNYMVEYVDFWHPHHKYCFLDELKGNYKYCIMPYMATRKAEIKKMVELKIPVRIGHKGKYSFAFNHVVPYSDKVNQFQSFNDLFDCYDNINSTVL